MNPYEQAFFEAQKEVLYLRRTALGYLCSGHDIQVPPRVKARGNLDIQNQDVLVKEYGLSRGSIVIDVGGYVGDTAFALAQAGVCVHTFEPFLENYLSLLWNLRDYNVHAYLAAVGNGEKVRFDYSFQDSDCGMLRVLDDPNGIPTMRLDDVAPWAHVDLIKIDCEGRELHVLNGAINTITKHRPPMLIESYPDGLKAQGFTPVQLHEKIRALGYSIHNDVTDYISVRDLACTPIK